MENVYTIFNQLHEILYLRYQSRSQTFLAQRMEAILTYLKLSVQSEKTQPESIMMEIKKETKNELLNSFSGQLLTKGEKELLEQIANTPLPKSKKTIGSLLWTAHKDYLNKTYYGFDDVAEQGVASFLSAIFNNTITKKKIQSYSAGHGKNANIAIESWFKDFTTEYMQQGKERIKGSVSYLNPLISARVKAQPQKTDISTLTAQISANVDPNSALYNLQTIFAGHTFTIKNYAALDWIGNGKASDRLTNIHLGETNLFKSVYGPLAALYDKSLAKHIFYEAMNLINNDTAFIAKHIFHIRFIYELTGFGLLSVRGKLSPLAEAEFLIVNNPDMPDIHVRSCADIILHVLESDTIQATTTIGLARALEALTPHINLYKN